MLFFLQQPRNGLVVAIHVTFHTKTAAMNTPITLSSDAGKEYIYVCMYVYVNICICTCIYVQVKWEKNMYVYVCVYICMYMYV